MRLIKLIVVVIVIVFLVTAGALFTNCSHKKNVASSNIDSTSHDSMVIYGKELIIHTSKYLGPHGTVAQITNGLNCGNCHMDAGTKLNTNNFLLVAATYPRFRERSGRYESVEFRINDCLQRSLDGKTIDSLSKEMKAMVAYINWTGRFTNKNNADSVKTKEVSYIQMAADSAKGLIVYKTKCSVCHGARGQGLFLKDSSGYAYPPLWGNNSYAVSAGMYRLTKLASFIKYNMPFGASYTKPLLSDEDAWNVAAYINSMPHPNKMFAADWPKLNTKPVDYPFGPYTDTFSQKQHKYGPYAVIEKQKKKI